MSELIEERFQVLESQIRRLNLEITKLNRMITPEELSRAIAAYEKEKKETQK
jgi:hypothetical protein